MKNPIYSLILGIALVASSSVITNAQLTQNQTLSGNVTPGNGYTFTFNQFNPNLGSLTAVELIINSSVPGGDFSLARGATGGTTLGYLTGFNERLEFSDDYDTFFTGSIRNISVSGNTTIPRNTTITYTVTGSQSLLSSVPSPASITPQAWNLYTGSGTVNIIGSITPTASFTDQLGISVNNNYLGLNSATSVTLQYTYSGSAAVPEPGQVAASLLLLGGIGGYIFIKRRRKPAVAAA